MQDITIATVGNEIRVVAPYSPEFPSAARQLGGKWDKATSSWIFDIRDQGRVESLLCEVYGYRADASGETVTVRIDASRIGGRDRELRFAGRRVAYRHQRDSQVILSENVVLVGGRFARSGGSMRNPAIGENDAVLEIRDLPVEALETETDYEIIEGDPQAGLRAERERLMARIAQIDALLDM